MPETMRAVMFDRPAPDTSTSRIARVAVPAPGPGEVAIEVAYAGVNFKDIMARRGDAGYVTGWPFTPGLEVAGEVRAVGAGVAEAALDRRVTAYVGSGGFAEVAIARWELCKPVPAGVELSRAAAAPGALSTAALLVDDFGHLRKGQTILVHGASGGVGQAAARLARLAGAGLVVGTVGEAARTGAAEAAGYDAVLVRDDEQAARIRELTGGRGVDLVLDPQGTRLLDLDLDVAAPGGRIVLFGNAAGTAPHPLPELPRLMAGNISLTGFSLAALTATAPAHFTAALSRVLADLESGALDIEFTIVDGLDRTPQAHQAMVDGRAPGKQVVRVLSD